jgi:hypothetical protein
MPDFITINTPAAVLEFPKGTPDADIRAAIQQHAPTAEARDSALNQWADQYVANARSGGGTIQTFNDTIRNLARGTPVGSWLDEANAGTAAATGQAPYDEALAYQRATDRAVDRDTGMLGTGTKIAGGVASAFASPVASIMRGASLLPSMVNAGLTGAGYGALYGAGEGETLGERGKNALEGTAVGGVLGAASAPVAKGVANAVGYVADKFKGVPAALGQYERGAVNRVSRAVGDDVPNNADIPQLAAQYGQQGMIADIGANLRGQAGAIARTPGEGKSVVLNALDQRADGATPRITAEINRTLGPEVNMPQAIDRIEKTASAAAKPHYEQFRQTPIPYTNELEDIVNVLKNEPSVLRDARRFANLDTKSGPQQFFANIANDGTVDIKRVPNAAEWDYMKRALDGLAYSGSATKNDRRVYGALSSRIKNTVDEMLSPGNPSQSPWALGRTASGEGTNLTDAMESGKSAFRRGISPDEMGAEIGNMSAPEKLIYTLGGRQGIRDVMGNSSTKWGANDDTAARKLLGSTYAQEKLGILAGPQNARRLTSRLDTETAFDKTREAAKGNSVTAAATAAQKEFPNAADATGVAREIGGQSMTGLGLRGLRALANLATGGAMNDRDKRIALDAAKMLTAQGSSRDSIAAALMDHRNSIGMTQAGKDAIDRILSKLGNAPRQQAIDFTTETVR